MLRTPKRIEELTEVFKPYFKDGIISPDAPEKAKNAFEEVKEWSLQCDGEQ